MKFFVPAATSDEQAEGAYRAFAAFVGAPIKEQRIWKLTWTHNGVQMACEVGSMFPDARMRGEPVLAIFDCESAYMICTPNRGGIRGEPILAGKGIDSIPTYFSAPAPS